MARQFKLRPYKPKPRYIPANVKHEEVVQKQLCSYLRLQYGHVIFRSDFASGLHMTPFQASKHRSLQSGRAFPDIFIYEPHGQYKGLALELKRAGTRVYLKSGALSANPHIREQAAVLADLRRRGYYAEFAIGLDDAIRQVDEYFGVVNTELF